MKLGHCKSLLIALFVLVLSACGGGSSTPAPTVTLTSIAVTPTTADAALNTTLQLTAIGTYSDSSTKDITTSVVWSSSAPAVARVGVNTGLLIPAVGASVGQTVVITANSGALTPASATITLKAASALFSLSTLTDPLVSQQWGLKNTAQTGFADSVGVANTGALGTDINADPVYSTYGFGGSGVTVAVVDSGLEILHEDLAANVVPGGSWDFANGTTDPTNTIDTAGDHGTMVSGLIAMAQNGLGGVGVASKAQLKGFNFLNSDPAYIQSYADEIIALGGSTASPNSSDVYIFNQSFGTSSTVDYPMDSTLEAQYASGTNTLRGGKGALYVKSAGNGFKGFGSATCTAAKAIGVSCQNANFDPSNTLPYNIVVGALNAKGKRSSYSTAGSAIWVSTPGGEYGLNASVFGAGYIAEVYSPAMVTVDQSGCSNGHAASTETTSVFNQGGANLGGINANCNYTNTMNGTSSAAPMMTGVIALMLEANPALTWREVKDILAKTSVKVDATIAPVTVMLGNGNYVAEQGWVTNAAGFKFHNWYGFGAVNAAAAVEMARTYVSGSLGTFINSGWVNSGALTLAIPDDSTAGQSVQLTVPLVGANKVEVVQVSVTTSAPVGTGLPCVNTTPGCTGDLAIELTSPSGTKSILKNIQDGFDGNNLAGMVLTSNAFYGENSNGTWTVKVLDGWSLGGIHTLNNVKIRVYGH